MSGTKVPATSASATGTESTSGRRFSLIRVLGEGSFGSVYLAEMEGAGGFKRRVALKLLHETWDPSSDAGRRLRDEARLLGRLEHRHIVRVDDLVRLNGRWALVMEYVSGADVEAVFVWAEQRAAPVPVRAVAELCTAVASAIVAAWDAPGDDGEPLRVVHRDIKPSNVRLTDVGDVKVLDFGVARAAFAGREARTERVRYGSLGYMAPERLLGEPDELAGDVYALGVLAYELLTLTTFGRAELGLDKQAAQVAAAREALLPVIGEGPLLELLVRMLAYDPGNRPPAAEVEDSLRALSRDLPGEGLATYARRVLPLVTPATTSGVTASLRGTILEESGGQEPTSRPSSATLIVAPDDFEAFVSEEARATAGAATTEIASAPRSAWRMGLALAGVALVALLAGAWLLAGPEDTPPPVATAPANDPVIAPAIAPAVAAASVLPEGTVAPSEVLPSEVLPTPVAVVPANAATGVPRARSTGTSRTSGAAGANPSMRAAAPESAPPALAPTAPATAPDAPRLRAAKFTLTGADGIRVTCGDVSGYGATAAILREFPAGSCIVTAAGLSTTVQLEAPRGVACAVDGASFTCR